jgi:twinkle protein
MFESAGLNSYPELEQRQTIKKKLLSYGVQFLDDALRGIFPDDLILLGAPSGVGKTQFCCNVAFTNIQQGSKVHFIALESSQFEIERRIKYGIMKDFYFKDSDKPYIQNFNFTDWVCGRYVDVLARYEELASQEFYMKYQNLFLFRKGDKFGINELIESVSYCSTDTDLIIIDHVHYFDFETNDENKAIKEISKTARALAIEQQKPIMLVAHLRKKDRFNDELIPGMEEFHGSSDLYKIATKVITIAPGRPTMDGCFETYFRISKNRLDGGVTRFSAKEFFDSKKGSYERDRYQIGWAEQSRSAGFEEVADTEYPEWGRSRVSKERSSYNYRFKGLQNVYAPKD